MAGSIFADPVAGSPSFVGNLFRALLSALTGGGGSRVFGASSGVNPRIGASIVTVTTTTWTVGAHSGMIDTSASGTDGATPYAFLTAQSGSINAASAANDRVDLLVVQLSDPSEGDGSATPKATIEYLAGTAGAGIPTNTVARSFVLAQISVPKLTTGSPSSTFVAPRSVAAGGIRPTSGSTQYPSAPYLGQVIDDASLGLLRWDGTAWSSPTPGSGWHNLALNGPYNDTAASAQYRNDGLHTSLRGRVAKTSGTDFATATLIQIAPAGAIAAGSRPNHSMAFMCTTSAGCVPVRVTVGSDGSVSVFTATAGVGVIDLAGCVWYAES